MEYKNLNTSVVIVAAGMGKRMGTKINKQYIEIKQKPLLARTIQAFEDFEDINEIILVVGENDIFHCKKHVIEEYGFAKVKSIVVGGKERQNSVYNGLKEVAKESDIVIIHDGARPFVTKNIISESIQIASEFGASVVGVPVKDTIKQIDDLGFIEKTLDRKYIWSIHTPQTFKYELIMRAHKVAIEEEFLGTDDTVLVERLGIKVKPIMGTYDNIKITTKEDIAIAQAILENTQVY